MLFNHFTNSAAMIAKPIGSTMATDWEFSNYWINKTVQKPQSTITDGFTQLFKLLGQIGMQIGDTDQIIEIFNNSKYYGMLLKEYIFEDIRVNEFPDKPSRKKCTYLVPQTLDLKEFAKSMNFSGDLKYLEIHPLDESKIHFGNIGLLNCDSLDHEVKINYAREYWKGSDEITKDTEVLYEGEFIITKILPFF